MDFKKIELKLELSTDTDVLLMIEEGIRGEICQAIQWYAKVKKYMKDYDKNKKSSYLKYWDVNILYGWAMLQEFPVNKFKWVEDLISQFNEDFIKTTMKKVMKDIFSKLIFIILKNYINFNMIYHFCLKE